MTSKIIIRKNNDKKSKRYSVGIDKIPKPASFFISPVEEKSMLSLITKTNSTKIVEVKIRKSLFLKLTKKQDTEAIKGRNNIK